MMETVSFAEAVLEVAADIPAGKASTYGDIAAVLGSRAPRIIGQIMATEGGRVCWWRVVDRNGALPERLQARALEHYLAEGTPLLWVDDAGKNFRVDLRRCRHNFR